jgi:hypothetical protein
MSVKVRMLPVFGLALAMGCQADSIGPEGGPVAHSELQMAGEGTSPSVMTRNLYVGANVDAVIAALASPDPSDDFPAWWRDFGHR